MGEPTKETLFKQPRTRMETKNAVTDKTAKGILERAAVDAKTVRLRAARLERERSKFSKE